MSSSLAQILAATRRRVAVAKATADLRQLERRAASIFHAASRRLCTGGQAGPAIIAELKKASPSRGLIRPDFDVAEVGAGVGTSRGYGVVRVDRRGVLSGIVGEFAVRFRQHQSPCLRKDFMVDEFQVLEALANCADAILLIVAALPQAELISLAEEAAAGAGCSAKRMIAKNWGGAIDAAAT